VTRRHGPACLADLRCPWCWVNGSGAASERLTSPLTVRSDLRERNSAQRWAATYSHGESQGSNPLTSTPQQPWSPAWRVAPTGPASLEVLAGQERAATANHGPVDLAVVAQPSSSRWWSGFQTPAACQSRSRRQQVTGLPHSAMQARTPRIMRFPQPDDPDGRPCLPTHHPRSQPPWPNLPTPIPANAKTPKPRTCWPTWPASRPVSCRGRRYPLVAIADWAADAPGPVRAVLGARHHASGHFSVPAEATIRRTLTHLDADALAGAVGAWLSDREPSGPAAGRRRAVAVDGKTLRGTRAAGGDGRPVHLLAAMDPTSRAVLTQRQVGAARGGPGFQPLLGPWTWPGWSPSPTRCRPSRAAEFLVTAKRAHHLLVVKPTSRPAGPLPAPAGPLPAPALAPRPGAGPHRDRGHGRVVLRTSRPCACATSASRTPPGPAGHRQDPRPRRPHPTV
jgi:hypothetical protein